MNLMKSRVRLGICLSSLCKNTSLTSELTPRNPGFVVKTIPSWMQTSRGPLDPPSWVTLARSALPPRAWTRKRWPGLCHPRTWPEAHKSKHQQAGSSLQVRIYPGHPGSIRMEYRTYTTANGRLCTGRTYVLTKGGLFTLDRS